jgi:hypothetical protein
MAPNTITVKIPANCQVQITAAANASLTQRVTVTVGSLKGTFTGAGEAVQMILPDSTDTLQLAAILNTQNCKATFEYKDEWSEWRQSRVGAPNVVQSGPFTTIQVAADDTSISSDTDMNDAILTIFCFSLGKAISSHFMVPPVSEEVAILPTVDMAVTQSTPAVLQGTCCGRLPSAILPLGMRSR